MPSLNVGKYIEKCLKSVVNQTFIDMEILCIDAGSIDGTLDIIEHYAQVDSRIRLIHSDKKSYGYQINLGVNMAKADYIGIVETDDFIDSQMYERLYSEILKQPLDYVKCKAFFASEIFPEEFKTVYLNPLTNNDYYGDVLCPKEYPELEFSDRFIWNGLYKKELMEEVKLNESAGAAFQDVGFAFNLHLKAIKAVYIDYAGYYYRVNNNEASCCNPKSFRFFLDEYYFAGINKKEISFERKCQVYLRMFAQFETRIRMMAEAGRYWDEKSDDIEEYRKILLNAAVENYIGESNLSEGQLIELDMLKDSAKALYGIFLYRHLEEKRRMKKYLKQFDGKEIILFGTGKKSLYIHGLLSNYNKTKLIAYCDNKASDNQMFRGLPVYMPDIICEDKNDAVYVITSLKYGNEMKKQLNELNIPDFNIVIYNMGENTHLLN